MSSPEHPALAADPCTDTSFVALRSGSRVLEEHCCRAASGARAAGGPCAPGRLADVDLGSCDCSHGYPAQIAAEPSALPPVPSSLSVVRLRVSADEASPPIPTVLRRRQASDNVSTPQQKPLGGYGEDTQKWAITTAGVCAFSLLCPWHGVTWFRRRTLRWPDWCGLSRVSCVKMSWWLARAGMNGSVPWSWMRRARKRKMTNQGDLIRVSAAVGEGRAAGDWRACARRNDRQVGRPAGEAVAWLLSRGGRGVADGQPDGPVAEVGHEV
jgi:hypothetical protein